MISPMHAATIVLAGETVQLLPERAAFWGARQTLIVADLHLGKCETLRAAGMPIPPGVIERDLSRLASAITQTGATRIVVVGDLIHHGSGLTPELVEGVADFRRRQLARVEIALVRGNHDRHADQITRQWGITLLADFHLEGPFGFAHDPADGLVPDAACTWFGHVHPLIRVGARGDGVSIPCFVVHDDHILLPAFSQFTRGGAISPIPGARVYGIAEDRVVAVPGVSGRARKPSCLDARPG
jgi:DNA ligase-associated metallophosphoesterase